MPGKPLIIVGLWSRLHGLHPIKPGKNEHKNARACRPRERWSGEELANPDCGNLRAPRPPAMKPPASAAARGPANTPTAPKVCQPEEGRRPQPHRPSTTFSAAPGSDRRTVRTAAPPEGLAANLCGLRNKHSFQKETSLPAVFRTRLNAAADERPAKFKFFRLGLPRQFRPRR